MNGCAAIRTALTSTQHLINRSLNDLSDADLLVHPVEGSNHIAWQIGHLIAAECRLCGQVPGFQAPPLPAGFLEKHANEGPAQQAGGGFLTRQQYIDLFNKTREATLTAVSKLSDADLDRPATGPGNIKTVGELLLLVPTHTMMHGGQFSVVRRRLNKPVLF